MSKADPLKLLLSHLNGVQQSRGRFLARCPAHSDNSPSLSLSRGKDGRALIHCHAAVRLATCWRQSAWRCATCSPAT